MNDSQTKNWELDWFLQTRPVRRNYESEHVLWIQLQIRCLRRMLMACVSPEACALKTPNFDLKCILHTLCLMCEATVIMCWPPSVVKKTGDLHSTLYLNASYWRRTEAACVLLTLYLHNNTRLSQSPSDSHSAPVETCTQALTADWTNTWQRSPTDEETPTCDRMLSQTREYWTELELKH